MWYIVLNLNYKPHTFCDNGLFLITGSGCLAEVWPVDTSGLHNGCIKGDCFWCFIAFVQNGTISSWNDIWLRNLLSIYMHYCVTLHAWQLLSHRHIPDIEIVKLLFHSVCLTKVCQHLLPITWNSCIIIYDVWVLGMGVYMHLPKSFLTTKLVAWFSHTW